MTLISTKNVKKYYLKNGLTVLLEVNKAAPVISLNMGVRVGSVWEKPNQAGLSHVLEHMVFKGSKSYQPGEMAKIVEGCGGEFNAYTSFDRTVYYINLPSQYWLTGLKLLKEMVFDATIDVSELVKEKEVILEELRRSQDQPDSILSEMLFKLAYPNHPYGRPIIGFEETIKSFERDHVLDFYRQWYVPNNVILGICGDFDEADMIKAIEQLEFPPESILSRPLIPDEVAVSKPRLIHKHINVAGTYLSIALPLTPFKHPDTPALDLLAHLLGGGETSRLEQVLKEQKGWVNAIHTYAYTPYYPGLFVIDALVPDKHVHDILPAIWEQIELYKTKLFSEEELLRAKLNMKSSLIFDKETCEGTARKWMVYETIVGDYRYEEEYLKNLDQVDEKDIRQIANQYLSYEASSTAFLYPQKIKEVETIKVDIKPKHKPAHKTKFELLDEYNDIQKYRLMNGIRVIVKENHRLPLMALKFLEPGGLRFESKITNGSFHLMARLLEKGTKTRSAYEIAKAAESIAGHISGLSGRNSWGLSSVFLSDKLEKGCDLFCDVLLHPAFDPTEFKKEQRLTLEAIKHEEDSLAHMAFKLFQETLFQKHPYGLPLLGTKKTIKSLKCASVGLLHQQLMNPQDMIISAVGDFNTLNLLEFFSDQLSFLNSQTSILKPPSPEPRPRTITQKILKKRKMQAHLVIGFLGAGIHHPDRYTLEVIHHILSGQGGRLFLDLRDEQSLAYSVTSTTSEGIEPGFFATYIGTDPSKLELATKGILFHLEKLRTEKVPEQELDRAKNYIIGSHLLDMQKNSSLAAQLAIHELYDFPVKELDDYSEKIKRISQNDILNVAQKYFTLDAYVMAAIKP